MFIKIFCEKQILCKKFERGKNGRFRVKIAENNYILGDTCSVSCSTENRFSHIPVTPPRNRHGYLILAVERASNSRIYEYSVVPPERFFRPLHNFLMRLNCTRKIRKQSDIMKKKHLYIHIYIYTHYRKNKVNFVSLHGSLLPRVQRSGRHSVGQQTGTMRSDDLPVIITATAHRL